jgi:hypothetical protein
MAQVVNSNVSSIWVDGIIEEMDLIQSILSDIKYIIYYPGTKTGNFVRMSITSTHLRIVSYNNGMVFNRDESKEAIQYFNNLVHHVNTSRKW